jgi:hypothetical protein
MKLIVQDNFLPEEEREELKLCQNNIKWYERNDYSHTYGNLCMTIMNCAKLYFNLDNCCGYEMWAQHNARPFGWHQDKDELASEKGNLNYPICSCIYYPYVDVSDGGNLILECGTEIVPKTNRLILFSPQVYHNVDYFLGERVSILVNPWNFIPLSHNKY